jgi:uncharacterized protein (DUF2062 family)
MHHPRLWHLTRRGVALGAAIGIFFGLTIPVAQIPLSAIAAIAMRANLPVAVTSTLVSNPVTFAPIYLVAYRIGTTITGETAPRNGEVTEQSLDPRDDDPVGWFGFWWQRISALGRPLIVGVLVMASIASVLTYALIDGVWRLTTLVTRRRRLQRRAEPARDVKPP